jgi:starch synthase
VDLSGILNGVDYSQWNPAVDSLIAKRYDEQNLAGKRTCKAKLQRTMGLTSKRGVPLIGMISRLTSQKGFDLVQEVFGSLMERNVQVVLLGSGEKRYEEFFSEAAAQYPDKLAVRLGFDETLAHQIEAAADIFLMPSLYEPCGLNQMYSMRYGTVPLVRATGGLDDTVEPFDPETGAGTGFKFGPYNAQALLDKVREALYRYTQKEAWRRIQLNGMAVDNSWGAAARKYVRLYHALFDL